MTDKIVRLFNIMNAIQANPGIAASDLALKYEVSVRSIYRDIDTLSLFSPITSEGRGTGYRFISKFFMNPLNFTDQEALVVSLLPSVIDRDKLPPGFDTAYDKIMASHQNEQSKRSNLITDITDMIQMGTPAYRKESPNFLHTVIKAILEKKTINAVYHTQSRNETTARQIDPYYLVPREQRFYLIGYCRNKGKIRTFRVSRFNQVELTNETFDKSGFNIKKHLKHTWSIEQSDRLVTFKVRFSPEVARYIKEEELFVRPRMKEKKDGSLIFEVTVNNDNEFLRWLRQYGSAAEILEPQSVRDSFKSQLEEWSRLYS
ncbi:helix-turn-helix transcriptional regulator [Paenibacillus sp. GCM10027627]|uniref:helix-turn-helix transcriptional regulator n=1 Tax=unclassified Paenibacillus TaxID=185978 RepID=UPI00362D415B